jgi:septal ring factor EnvC (AmiA/AmiB activator)
MNAKRRVKFLLLSVAAVASASLATLVLAESSSELAGLTALSNYGFGGVMTAALGYALWGLYRAHNEERKTWLEKWEQHFQRLLDTLRESDKARHELAEEVRSHMRDHGDLNEEVRKTLDRIADAMERNGR